MAEQKVKLTDLPAATDTIDTAQLLINQNSTDQKLPVTHFLRAKNNLSDLSDIGQARANLDVPSVDEVNDKLTGFIDGSNTFLAGASLASRSDFIWDEESKSWYYWKGELPKDVPAASNPASTGGVGDDAWGEVGSDALQKKLADSTAAGIVGATDEDGNPTTVQDILDEHQGDIDSIEGQINQTGHVFDLAREGTATLFGQRYRVPHRLVNKTIPNTTSKKYDHFGIMDIKADGTLYQMFRRGANHTDEGTIQYSEFMKNGQWSAVRTIAAIPGLDCRNAAGGTGPDGAMYLAFVTMDPNADPNTTPNVFHDLIIFKSKDYGQNWTEVGRFPKQGTDISPYGRICTVGDRLYITYYGNNSAGTRFLSLLASDNNGETWYSGPVISTGVAYNESDLLNLGGGAVLCISRTGSGTVGSDGSNRLRQFISGDGGNTWTDQGYVIGPDSANEIAWQLVSPSLSLVYSNGGTPYVLLAYAARRGTIRYRLKTVLSVTAGSSGWSNWYDAKSINTEFESGYQSQLVINNTIFFNYYAATTTGTVVVPTQFQQALGELPDFDSGWFAVAIGQNYTKPHGLGINPTRFNVMFSLDELGKANSFNMQSFQYVDGGAKGVGAVVQSNNSGFSISTGSYSLQLGNAFGATHPPDVTTGYIRVVAYK